MRPSEPASAVAIRRERVFALREAGLTFRAIGEREGISQSRALQIHADAVRQRADAPPPWPEAITPALGVAATPFSRRTRKLLAQTDYATLGDMLACDRTELTRDLLSRPDGCRRVLNEIEAMLANVDPSQDASSGTIDRDSEPHEQRR